MATDEYEKQFMGADGALYTERFRNRFAVLAALGGSLGAIFGGVNAYVATGSLWPALAGLAFATVYAGGLAVFFAFTRVAVTREHVHIQAGMLGPKIPIAAITNVVRRGSRLVIDRPTYGSSGKELVQIDWSEGGRTRRIAVGTNDAAALMAAIDRARGVAPPAAAVRVADPDAVDEEAAAEESASEAKKSQAGT